MSIAGGFVSDRVVKRLGPKARLLVLAASQFIAAPFVAGALFFDTPLAYYSLIPGYIVGQWKMLNILLVRLFSLLSNVGR